jgi:hypothetical protein
MTRTTVIAKTTRTSAFNETGVDVDPTTVPSLVGDWKLVLEVTNLVGLVRFTFEDNLGGETTWQTGPTCSLVGPVTKDAPKRFTWNKRDFPDLNLGVADIDFRISLAAISGAGATATYESWIES